MESKQNWRLRYWIIGGYAVPIVALIASAIITIFNTNTVNHRAGDLVSSYGIKSLIDDLDSNTQNTSRLLLGYLLVQDKTSLKNYQKSKNNSKKFLTELSRIPEISQEQQSLNRLEQLLNQLNEIDKNLIAKVEQGKVREAIDAWNKSDRRALVNVITNIIDELQSRETEKVATTTKQQQEALNTLRLVLMLASVLSLLLSVLIGFWVIRRSAQQMTISASAIATSTTEIATTIEQQERAAIQQASSVNQTTTTMDELGASSRQSAEQAKASADNAQQVLLLIDGRVQDTQQGQSNQSSLREKVGDIANQILHLSEQTNQIGTISTLVSDLASQTNMLALNAAVEAVRAGEHGKGFALVAAEIRKLADQSKTSAEKINELVSDIQKSTNSTVMVTNEGTKTVEEIIGAMKTIALNGQQIALTSNQQAIAVRQVVEAMNSLNITARETASGISQIKVGTQQLNEAAQALKAVV